MARGRSFGVLLLLALGCGGESTRAERQSDEPAKDTQGGRRLEAVFIESADGVGVFRYFYDTELEMNCNFEAVGADEWRCLPDDAEAPRILEIVYTDAECNEPHTPLLRSSHGLEGCTPPRYAVVTDECGASPSVFEIGPPSSADSWYRVIDGVCAVSNQGTDYLMSLFAATPIALEEFQSARLDADETAGVVPVDLQSDDGARVRLGFRDALEGFDCRLEGADDDSRCVPAEAGLMGYLFADAECTQPAAIPVICGSAQNEMAYARTLFGDEPPAYHRGGARLATSYTGGPQSCVESANSVGFEVGAAISSTRFPPGRRTTAAGGDLAVTVETVGTASLPAHTLRSTAHGGYDCHFARGVDGELRCMPPPETFFDGFFADASCTAPVEFIQEDVLALEVPSVCPPEVRVYARGDRHTGPVYAVTDGACTLAHEVPPNDGPRSPHYVFPTEIPATEFTPLFEVTR